MFLYKDIAYQEIKKVFFVQYQQDTYLPFESFVYKGMDAELGKVLEIYTFWLTILCFVLSFCFLPINNSFHYPSILAKSW